MSGSKSRTVKRKTKPRVKSKEPVKFKPDKIVRPSIPLLRQMEDGQITGTARDKLLRIKMDADDASRASQAITVKLTNMTIINWRTSSFRLGFGGRLESDIYVISTVADGVSQVPLKLELKSFPHVKQGDRLSIGGPGVQMYFHSGTNIPPYLDIRILVARNRQRNRDAGAALLKIRQDQRFGNAISQLSTLAAGPIGVAFGQVDTIMGIIGTILSLQPDDQLMLYAATFTRDFDNLGIGKICDKAPDTEPTVDFCYNIQVGQTRKRPYSA